MLLNRKNYLNPKPKLFRNIRTLIIRESPTTTTKQDTNTSTTTTTTGGTSGGECRRYRCASSDSNDVETNKPGVNISPFFKRPC